MQCYDLMAVLHLVFEMSNNYIYQIREKHLAYNRQQTGSSTGCSCDKAASTVGSALRVS